MEQRLRIGSVIRAYRLRYEIDQDEVAREIGIAASGLNRLEHGVAGISVEGFGKVLAWLLQPDPVFEPVTKKRKGART